MILGPLIFFTASPAFVITAHYKEMHYFYALLALLGLSRLSYECDKR